MANYNTNIITCYDRLREDDEAAFPLRLADWVSTSLRKHHPRQQGPVTWTNPQTLPPWGPPPEEVRVTWAKPQTLAGDTQPAVVSFSTPWGPPPEEVRRAMLLDLESFAKGITWVHMDPGHCTAEVLYSGNFPGTAPETPESSPPRCAMYFNLRVQPGYADPEEPLRYICTTGKTGLPITGFGSTASIAIADAIRRLQEAFPGAEIHVTVKSIRSPK